MLPLPSFVIATANFLITGSFVDRAAARTSNKSNAWRRLATPPLLKLGSAKDAGLAISLKAGPSGKVTSPIRQPSSIQFRRAVDSEAVVHDDFVENILIGNWVRSEPRPTRKSLYDIGLIGSACGAAPRLSSATRRREVREPFGLGRADRIGRGTVNSIDGMDFLDF